MEHHTVSTHQVNQVIPCNLPHDRMTITGPYPSAEYLMKQLTPDDSIIINVSCIPSLSKGYYVINGATNIDDVRNIIDYQLNQARSPVTTHTAYTEAFHPSVINQSIEYDHPVNMIVERYVGGDVYKLVKDTIYNTVEGVDNCQKEYYVDRACGSWLILSFIKHQTTYKIINECKQVFSSNSRKFAKPVRLIFHQYTYQTYKFFGLIPYNKYTYILEIQYDDNTVQKFESDFKFYVQI